MSWVTTNSPKAPEPLACMRRSGITSRSKCASFSRNQTSCSSMGPRGPAVITFWLSATGAPATVVSLGLSVISHLLKSRSEEHTSELQSRPHLVCRLLLEKKKKKNKHKVNTTKNK